MPVSPNEFSALSKPNQQALLIEFATVIGHRRQSHFHYTLFNVEGLYIEEVMDNRNPGWHAYLPVEDTDVLLCYVAEVEHLLV